MLVVMYDDVRTNAVSDPLQEQPQSTNPLRAGRSSLPGQVYCDCRRSDLDSLGACVVCRRVRTRE